MVTAAAASFSAHPFLCIDVYVHVLVGRFVAWPTPSWPAGWLDRSFSCYRSHRDRNESFLSRTIFQARKMPLFCLARFLIFHCLPCLVQVV